MVLLHQIALYIYDNSIEIVAANTTSMDVKVFKFKLTIDTHLYVCIWRMSSVPVSNITELLWEKDSYNI